MEDNKWETYNEELEDDLMMEDNQEDTNDTTEKSTSITNSFKANNVYPEDFVKNNNPYRSRSLFRGMGSFDLTSASSPFWNETLDDKGDPSSLLKHLEKTIVHGDFFNKFTDDFDDDDDLA